MFNLYNNIIMLCKKHGTTPTQLCIDAGLGRSALSNLKNNRIKSLSIESIQKIADYLGEPYDLVAHGQIENNDAPVAEDILQSIDDNERALLHAYRTMTDDEKVAMQIFLRGIKGGNDD